MKLKKRAAALVMALTLCMAAGATVNAATVSTSEFGTMTYSLSRSGATVTAVTKTTKAAPKLITKLEVQVNSTGKTIVNTSATKTNATNNTIIKATNYTSTKLAAFSTHEARGTLYGGSILNRNCCEDGFVVA